MDETLIHTFDFQESNIGFYKRPLLDEFINEMEKHFEIVIFTAACRSYANRVLDKIDPDNKFSHRLYREDMKLYNGDYIKDISILGRDLSKVIIVDNMKENFTA